MDNDILIPDRIIQIWLGDKQPSALLQHCHNSVIQEHKNWEHILITDTSLFDQMPDKFPKRLHKFWKVLENGKRCLPYRADVLKLVSVYLLGGIFLDYDMFCCRSLERFRTDKFIFGCIISNVVGELIIGARQKQPEILELLDNFVDMKLTDTNEISMNIFHFVHQRRLKAYDTEYFCPHFRQQAIADKNKRYYFTKNTHFIHCWSNIEYDIQKLEEVKARIKGNPLTFR